MGSSAIAVFHPGAMGAPVGACAVAGGHRVLCSLDGRSAASQARAREAGLENAGSMKAALSQCGVVLSVCPPHGALALAREVAALGFKGLYVDCNAVSPETARRAAAVIEAAGAGFVDGGLVGAPPEPGKPVRLLLAGERAAEAAELFQGTDVSASLLPGPVGSASALKACFATWSKGTWLLLASILATAEHEGVAEPLKKLWAQSHPDALKMLSAPSTNPGKAWRWLSEMNEIAAAFESAGQPDGFLLAAAEICRRLEHYKDTPSRPSIQDILPSLDRARTT